MTDQSPERWKKIDALCKAALEVQPGARAAFLRRECGDPEILEEVESLLGYEQSGDRMFEPPPLVGSYLGGYLIAEKLGSGGMGEVYRASDSRLNRDVAIKLLPAASEMDSSLRARLQREAKLLASLNHPNIAAIHGIEDSGSRKFLVMELVPGETLAERIQRGPIPVAEALQIARQLAEALEEAHEKGVLHRDLKPANIKITPQDKVKVLDFGLAKAYRGRPAAPNLPLSPDSIGSISTPGMIIGSAPYMSPEQTMGQEVDKRTDIFAFGAVLYEMLAGRRAFPGAGAAEILAAVLKSEPDWSRLPAGLPPGVRNLLRLCLEKDRRNRRSDAADVRLDIDLAMRESAPAEMVPKAASLRRGKRVWLAAAVLLALAFVSAMALRFIGKPAAAPVSRFSIAPPRDSSFDRRLAGNLLVALPAVSPDGQKLAFTALNPSGKPMLWVRPIDELDSSVMPGTEGAYLPFWSPDSRFIAFFAAGKLKRVGLAGRTVHELCDAPMGRGGSWNQEGVIIFNPNAGIGGLHRVAAAGGASSELMKPASNALRFPSFLPDGRHFLYLAVPGGVYVGSLDGGEPKHLFDSESAAAYASGNLLFVRRGTLLSQPFDPDRLVLAGEPVAVAERILYSPAGRSLTGTGTASGLAAFSASRNGVLSYTTGTSVPDLQLTWMDRTGKTVAKVGPPGAYRGIDLSPDGNRIAVHLHDDNGGDIWLIDARGTLTRFTFDASQHNSSPVWFPDGSRVAFASLRDGKRSVYQALVNGGSDDIPLAKLAHSGSLPLSWSPDGKRLLLAGRIGQMLGGAALWVQTIRTEENPILLPHSGFDQNGGQISPDGRWVAYASDESGQREIYVRPFPSGPGKWKISTTSGAFPRWSRSGKQIYYLLRKDIQEAGKLFSVAVNATGTALRPESPVELFDPGFVLLAHSEPYSAFAVSPDEQRFLIPRPIENPDAAPPSITVVLNWTSALNR